MNIQYIVYYHIDIHCTYTSRVLWEHVLCGVCSEMASEVVTVQPECQYMYCTCVAHCLWYVPIYTVCTCMYCVLYVHVCMVYCMYIVHVCMVYCMYMYVWCTVCTCMYGVLTILVCLLVLLIANTVMWYIA